MCYLYYSFEDMFIAGLLYPYTSEFTTGVGATFRLPQYQWRNNPEWYG